MQMRRKEFYDPYQLVSFSDDWDKSWRDESVVSETDVNTVKSGAISFVFDLCDQTFVTIYNTLYDYESVSGELENALCHVLKVMSLC